MRVPKEPFHVEARIQPVDVHLPQQDVRVTASGIPDKIKLEWDGRQTPLDLKWPSDPLRVNVNLSGNAGANNSPCCCKDGSTPASPREVSDPSNEKRLRAEIDALNKEIDRRTSAEKEIRDKADRQRKKLEAQHDRGELKDSDYENGLNDVHNDTKKELKRAADDATQAMLKDALSVIFYLAGFGALGGMASAFIEWINGAKKWRAEHGRPTAVEKTYGSPSTIQSPQPDPNAKPGMLRSLGKTQITITGDFVPAILLGVVAALIVPIGMLFIPGVKLQTASADPFHFVSLCSLCFAVAMIGEPFIEFVLQRLRNLATDEEPSAKTVSLDYEKASEPPSTRNPESPL